MKMLLPYICLILTVRSAVARSNRELSARELDSLLQGYAFRAFVRPRTGVVYSGEVPANLTGVEVAALRLRSGSLRRVGFDSYRQFNISVGVVVQPYVERVVLVYHNLGNWSSLYYPLPGYTYLAPVLGLLAYDASDLTATNLSELDVRASGDPIRISFEEFGPVRGPGKPMCVFFGLDGSVEFDNVVYGSACLTTSQGHFSIVEESVASPAPAPAPATALALPSPSPPTGGVTAGGGISKGVWIIGGSVIGGAALLVLLVVVLAYASKFRHRKKIRRMEDAAELGVPLPMRGVGQTKAPMALETRTRPSLENEFVP